MPRKLTIVTTLDEFEDEVLFTRASLKADPDAEDLLPATEGWLAMVDQVRLVQRRVREAVARADAARMVANARLDEACGRFGDELVLAVGKDRKSARFHQFFRGTSVVAFCKQAFGKQVAAVKAWPAMPDEVFARHKDGLLRWAGAGEAALAATSATAAVRGEAAIAEEQLAADLTRERDGLHDRLSERARERRLPRDWPDAFFRIARRSPKAESPLPEPAPQE